MNVRKIGENSQNLPPDTEAEPVTKKIKAKIPKILDGTFYTIETNVNGKVVAVCVECKEKRRGDVWSTGNYKSHYKTSHQKRLKELENYLNDSKKTDNLSNDSQCLSRSAPITIRNFMTPIDENKVSYCFYNS